jgi:hypothetical protein
MEDKVTCPCCRVRDDETRRDSSKICKPLLVVSSILRDPIGLVIGAQGYQVTGRALAENVVICGVLGQLYGTLYDEYVVILGQIPNKMTI